MQHPTRIIIQNIQPKIDSVINATRDRAGL